MADRRKIWTIIFQPTCLRVVLPKRRRAAALRDAGVFANESYRARSVLECASLLALWTCGRDARDDTKLFNLFDDEHFDWHIRGNKFEAELIGQSLFQFFQVRIVVNLVSNFFDAYIPFEVENIMVGESCFIDYGTS
jgi:hypothetical protein